MKASVGVASATLFDDGPGWAPSGTTVTITVYARGNWVQPVSLVVSSSNGGTFSKTLLTIPAGANGQDTFTFTAPVNTIVTLSYSSLSAGVSPPPPRRIYSLTDPVAYAATSVSDAAMALIAKYNACKWEMADGYTDYLQGAPAAAGQPVRAISDSGYGSSVGNAMEMLNWVNNDSATMGTMVPPVMRVVNGRKNADFTGPDTWGFWCKKTIPVAQIQPNPRNRVPYNIADPHFAIAAVSVPGLDNGGIVFQASQPADWYASELRLAHSQPQVHILDRMGVSVTLTSPTRLAANTPAVLTLTCVPGAQRLRVNSAVVASAAASFTSSEFEQLLIGWGFQQYYPRDGFAGNIYSVVTGKGAPTPQELAVLEKYLGATAGVAL
ncbi:MAG: twin-arginine translocation pathway signal protein, partial [Ramlibacter sp.]